jgi:positive phototaxis protein PixI
LNVVSDRQPHQSSLDESADLTHQQFLIFQIHPPLVTSLAHLDYATGTPVTTDEASMSVKPLLWSIEIDRVTELINIPIDRVVPMPHLPPAVMGVYNWRGEILWIVDLATLLGVKTTRSSPRYRNLQPTIVLTSAPTSEDRQQKTIGLVVDEIAEIEWCDLDLIQSPRSNDVYPEFSKWARGLWVSAPGESFLVLDGQAIINQADFHADV